MKKKLIVFSLFALAITALLCISALAAGDIQGECGSGVRYELDLSTGELVISGNGYMSNYSAYTVPWYSNRHLVRSVVVEDGVMSIGDYAFSGCLSLSDVQIADSVEYIGNYAFYDCSSLDSIVLPWLVKSLGNYCFFGCVKLDEINYGGTTYLGITARVQGHMTEHIH